MTQINKALDVLHGVWSSEEIARDEYPQTKFKKQRGRHGDPCSTKGCNEFQVHWSGTCPSCRGDKRGNRKQA